MGFVVVTSSDLAELIQDQFPGTFQYPDERYGSLTGQVVTVWTGAHELRKVTILYTRNFTGLPPQDYAMTTHHFLNLTGGNPDATWTTSDYTTEEGFMDAFWTTMKTWYPPQVHMVGYRWSADGPAFRPFGSALSPTLRNTNRDVAGSAAAGLLPPQVAMSVTETTDAKYTAHDVEGVGDQLRNRWGRFYMPAAGPGTSVNGRIASDISAALAAAVDTWYTASKAADLIPVMYSPTTGNSWSIVEIHVDDIFDVIRSRRFVTPLTRNAQPIT